MITYANVGKTVIKPDGMTHKTNLSKLLPRKITKFQLKNFVGQNSVLSNQTDAIIVYEVPKP